jgi:1,4-alpha-glucan branching enzyme
MVMTKPQILSIVLSAHLPLGRQPEPSPAEDHRFFELLSGTLLPLLEVFDRLDRDRVPFRLALALSPTLCHQLEDGELRERYLDYTERQISFGLQEIQRTAGDPALEALARLYYERTVERRFLFAERCGGRVLKALDSYQKKGRLEILTTAATYAFLPLYAAQAEALQAQLEVAIASHRRFFGKSPQGFWLPELGWTAELDRYLRAYNFAYTVVEPHGLLAAGAEKGSFFPVKTPGGVLVLGRDFYAGADLERMRRQGVYRDNREDAGYELPAEMVQPFLDAEKARGPTGYKYWAAGGKKIPYDTLKAGEQAVAHAREFLDARISRLSEAGELMKAPALSLCAWDADDLGCRWYEGPLFLEELFRAGAGRPELRFMNPAEYLYKQDISSFQTLCPEFSSRGLNGYGEMWLDASNDWIYRHLAHALDRMIELAERFPNDTGLKERTLNQAAREILLAQASDWPRMLYRQESPAYAKTQVESCLRNFTVIYEALGSGHISTEWLTTLEKRHNIFPQINYRVFRRKS